ncbi:Type II secretory pathway, ATPase PulE/Tfp pilus assembly pathway, ATPase PilB [hydrothermal vent metagenome]|uniref:Type II secretory pathway, ATPase PulE/Tfp pilus assembly pathway, ATPase PilB n=1 Tax=hydrothermal vent metagenome TaxID=652676 RepID=A0A3B0Y590_9ZZZZ
MNAVMSQNEKKLDIQEVLTWLENDAMVTDENVRMLRTLAVGREYREKNALSVIAERNWVDQRNGHSLLTIDLLANWLAEKVDIPFFRIDPLKIEVGKITAVMSYAYASRFNILPISVDEKYITIATAEPFVKEWEHELSRINHKEFKRVISSPDDIARYLLEFYAVSRSVRRAETETQGNRNDIGNLESLMELGRAGKLDANDQHVVNIVDWLLQYAYEQRASDIHLEPRREQGNVRFRIDGVMHQVYQVPSAVMAAVSSRIKILGRMDVAEKRRPQDGRLKTRTPDGVEVELRLSTMPTAFGEKLVMRIFDPEVLVKNFRELGFSQSDDERWQSMIAQPNGIILVTGPTGSGKTTTLYTSLKQLAKPEVNVCTVEDPIELVEGSFNQMQVQHNIGLDFSQGVRTLMRQDPDIIMIGEIRDRETADIAIQAALTGHLVVSTLHTNDAPSAVTRLMEIGVPAYLIQSTILGIMAQRLVRTLCPHCKAETEIDDLSWKALVKPWKPAKPVKIYQPVGCLECRNTGFLGRMGVYEMFTFSDKIKSMVTDNVNMVEFKKAAMKEGMRPLRLSGAQKVAAGLTTVEEVLRVAPPVEY